MEDFNRATSLHDPKARTKSLMDLPTELHMHIASFLNYPDALALKHTNRHFYSFVYTGIYLKISWLLERFERKLECPQNEKCSFRTDESFCNSKTVRKIMKRRRRHLECKSGMGGCYVIYGGSCRKARLQTWLEQLNSCEGLRNEVFTLGFLFLFWTLTWHAVKLFVKEVYILNLGFGMIAALMALMMNNWCTELCVRHTRMIFNS